MIGLLANRLHHREGRERGAVLIISTVGFALAVICAAIAVDLGRLVADNRKMQNIADLAALDAVRAFDDPTATSGLVWALAADSARRNGYEPTAADHTFVVEMGKYENHQFTYAETAASGSSTVVDLSTINAVRVRTRNLVDWLLQPGDGHSDGVGVASKTGNVTFEVGSALATLTPDDATLLGKLLTRLVGASPAIDLLAVSYNGLLNGTVTLGEIQDELLNAGYSFGTPDELVTTDILVADFYRATADALRNDGLTAQANAIDLVATRMSQTATMKIGALAVVDMGNGSVLDAELNAFNLLTGTAMIMNGDSVVSVPSFNIAGVQTVSMDVGEGPRMCPQCFVGMSAETQQVETTLTTTIPLGAVNLSLPLVATAASGKGTTAAVENCGLPTQRAVIAAHSEAATISGAANVTVHVLIYDIPLRVTVNLPLGEGNGNLVYDYPADFGPPAGSAPAQRIGVSAINLSSASITIAPIGAVPALAVAALNSLINLTLRPALLTGLANISTRVFNPMAKLLGLQIGAADITATEMECAQPKLVA
jgi:uncharacterized membrane protein